MDQEDIESVLDSPLLPISEIGFGHGNHNLAKSKKPEIIVELKEQMRLAGPLVLVSFLQYSLQMISIMFVGHIDELSLASASLASSFAQATGFSFVEFQVWSMFLLVGLQFSDLDLETKGAALSIAISYWINVFILAIYIKFYPDCAKTWTGFSKEALDNILGFLELGIPSALMVCLEQWSFEFLVFISGLLSNPLLETSMMSISLDTSAVVFKVPFGFGSAVSTRVSNELGAGRPYAAHLAVQIVMLLAVTQGLFLSSVAVAVRSIWGYMYTNNEVLVRYLASVMPVLAISNFIDGMQAVLSGVARGCGRQKVVAFVNLGAYYTVGLPSAIILTFVFHFGGKGLWMGIICGSSLQALLLFAITMCTNWEDEAKKAKERMFATAIRTTVAS